jgi:hypothetical protein
MELEEGFCGGTPLMKILKLAMFFFILSPGVLLTLPPGARGVLMSRQTSLLAAAVHAVVFVLILRFFYGYYYEGYANALEEGFQMCSNYGGSCQCPAKKGVRKTGRCQKYSSRTGPYGRCSCM